jgi:hypothetical protein
MNSSPPRRAAVSLARRQLRSRAPTSLKTASPREWPSESLMSLNSSRSMKSTASPPPSRDAREIA